ncbi:MAG: RNA polymerase sigma factor [Myxococcota bacterium]
MEATFDVLLERCRAGDEASWRELFHAHHDFVYRSVRRLGVLGAEADDLTQDVFLVAFQKLGDFREGKLTTWLYRIAANLVSDRHRKRTLREALFGLFGAAEQARVHERTPDHELQTRETERQVAQVLQRMTQKKRDVFVLFELEHLSGDEIAERLGVPVGTVWTRLHHARAEFETIARKRGLVP